MKRPRVLIVDRNAVDGRVLEMLLQSWGEVERRSTAWQAMRALDVQGESYSAIFIEGRVLRESTILSHVSFRRLKRGLVRVVALIGEGEDSAWAKPSGHLEIAVLRKPYTLEGLARLKLAALR